MSPVVGEDGDELEMVSPLPPIVKRAPAAATVAPVPPNVTSPPKVFTLRADAAVLLNAWMVVLATPTCNADSSPNAADRSLDAGLALPVFEDLSAPVTNLPVEPTLDS